MAIKKEENITIPAINIQTAIIRVVGDSPLIMHKWSEKAKKEILDKQMKKAKTKGHDSMESPRHHAGGRTNSGKRTATDL